jgi:replicative DNA helicase
MGTMKNLTYLKDFGFALKCPFVAGVQAKREVDSRQIQIPGMDDGQWTSNIEQDSDKIITVTRPVKYRNEGDLFGTMPVRGHGQILLTLAKQKLGKDGIPVWAYFDPAYNKFDQLEMDHYDLRKDIG